MNCHTVGDPQNASRDCKMIGNMDNKTQSLKCEKKLFLKLLPSSGSFLQIN